MIEKKLPNLKTYLYGYEKLTQLSQSDISNIIHNTGFEKQIEWVIYNADKFKKLIIDNGSFNGYLENQFGIKDIYCSNQQLLSLYNALKSNFYGIGETAGWHFITELGFFSLKPDAVIRRIFYRLGLISNENNLMESIEVGRNLSQELNIPIRYLDIIFVKFGQVGESDLLGTVDGICTENNPKCNVCSLKNICKYNNGKVKESGSSEYINETIIFGDKNILIDEREKNIMNKNMENKNLKVRFKARYDKAPESLKTIFNELIGEIDKIGIENFSTDIPDYRLRKGVNFCLITFDMRDNVVRVHLRNDDIELKSDILEIRDLINHRYNGRRWCEVKLRNINEIEESIRLIQIIYKQNS